MDFPLRVPYALPASILSGLALKSASLLPEGAFRNMSCFLAPIRINNLPRLNTRPKFDAHLQQQKISFIFSNPPTPSIRFASDLSSGSYILSWSAAWPDCPDLCFVEMIPCFQVSNRRYAFSERLR